MQWYFLIFPGFLIFWAGFGTCALFVNSKRTDQDADTESRLIQYWGTCGICGCVVVRGRCVNGCGYQPAKQAPVKPWPLESAAHPDRTAYWTD